VGALQGNRVVVAGRDKDALAGQYDDEGVTAEFVPFALTNTFMTGVTLKVDGGEPLI